MKKIPIRTKSFSRLVEGNYYFVDKTLMIKEFLDRGTDVTLITRPRRFGKTINMSMMAEFFDITKDSKEIFKGTKIMETPYAAEINQYPTIFISFADAKRDKETVVSTIRTQIQNQWDKYDFVFENLKGFKKTNYERLYEVLADNNKNNLKGIDDAISFLMERMEDYYGKEVMVFIDEYDTPFVEAHTGGFYDEVRGGLAGLLHNSLKTSTSLKYAMLTGNQIGGMLTNYIIEAKKSENKLKNNEVLIKTIVTSEFGADIAKLNNLEVMNVLTGFKFIGEKIKSFEENNNEKTYLFGYEEFF